MLLIGIASALCVWLVIVAIVIGLCRGVARADRLDRLHRQRVRASHRFARQTLPARKTCLTVLNSSLTSAQSDQLAT